MQSNNLTLAICANFLPEAKAVLAQCSWQNVNLISWAPCCQQPPQSWEELASVVDVEDKAPLLIVGACFPEKLKEAPEHLDYMHLHPLEQCFHLLLSKNQVDTLVKEGSYLVSPAWVADWRGQLERWGFDAETAKIFFHDTAKKIVLLDTGILDNISVKAQEFATYVGLPFSRLDIGLDFISHYLNALVLEWQKRYLARKLQTSREQTATHAMALDLLDALSDKSSEDEAIAGVLELFRTLFAPQHIAFYPSTKNSAEANKPKTIPLDFPADCRRALESETFVIHEARDGFCVSLQSGAEVVGYVNVEQISFPDYLDRYLNLALSIAPQCALAIRKALITENLRNKVIQLENSEEALSKSEEKYRALYNNAPLSYQSLDKDGCLLNINPTWLKTLGYTRSEVIGQSFGDFLHPDWQPHFELNFPAFKKRGYVNDVQFKIRHKNGHYLDILFAGCIGYTAEGDFRQTYCVFQNITAQKIAEAKRRELETQLRQKHKMEAVGYMAGGMAHNFNNNLAIIMGNIDLAQLKQPQGSEMISFLEDARTAVRRSRDLINKILAFSRNDIQEKEETLITAALDDASILLQSTLPATIRLLKNYSPDSYSAVISADQSQFQEVLLNLCNNAVMAMGEKGNLTLAVESVCLHQGDIPANYDCPPGNYSKLSVQDSGCGIPTEIVDKIFDPFFSTKAEHEGAGMGLATVHGIVTNHGGFITVESILGQGTTFNLYFPVIDPPPKQETKAERSAPTVGGELILLVDDDEMIVTLYDKLLSKLGYTVTSMTDSSEAVKLFAANADSIDLVITDQTMPHLSGTDFFKELLSIKPNIPAILCSGYSSEIDEKSATQLGFKAFLLKPIDFNNLAQTVRRVLDAQKSAQ